MTAPASVQALAVAIAPGMSAEAPLTAQAPMADPCSGAGRGAFSRLEPLSPTRLRVQFTTRAEGYEKLEKVRELLSHAVPNGDLGELFERALDALITQETRKRFGAQTPRKPRKLEPGSRHVPVRIRRAVWERDGAQCTRRWGRTTLQRAALSDDRALHAFRAGQAAHAR